MEFISISIFIIVIVLYSSLVLTSYSEIKDKDLKVRLNFNNILFFFYLPLMVMVLHLKIAKDLYKKGRTKQARLLLNLSSFKLATGIAIFLEFMVHSSVVDFVYESGAKKINVVPQSKKIQDSIFTKDNIKKAINNPWKYEDSIFGSVA